jgi:flagellin
MPKTKYQGGLIMRINNNLMAMNALQTAGVTPTAGPKSMEKLSSGLRINRAGDDAAGLAISEKMRAQIRGLNQASRNAQDGISLIQTAEGALSETHAILQRMRELAVQAATDTNTEVDRSEIQKEVNELIDEINRIAEQTQFNELNLLDGSFSGKKFHIGANEGQAITLDINLMGSVFVEATQGTGVVDGVSNQTVLKDNDDEIVAVQVGGSWYAVDDVESNGDSSTLH